MQAIYVGCCSLHDVAGLVFCHGPIAKRHWVFDNFFIPRLPHCYARFACGRGLSFSGASVLWPRRGTRARAQVLLHASSSNTVFLVVSTLRGGQHANYGPAPLGGVGAG